MSPGNAEMGHIFQHSGFLKNFFTFLKFIHLSLRGGLPLRWSPPSFSPLLGNFLSSLVWILVHQDVHVPAARVDDVVLDDDHVDVLRVLPQRVQLRHLRVPHVLLPVLNLPHLQVSSFNCQVSYFKCRPFLQFQLSDFQLFTFMNLSSLPVTMIPSAGRKTIASTEPSCHRRARRYL